MTSPVGFMSFGFTEMLVVGVVALLVFGGELPDVMRNVGRAYAKFRQGLNEIAKPVREEIRNVSRATSSTPTRRPAPARPKDQPDASYEGEESPASDSTQMPEKRAPDPWTADEPPPV